MTKSKGQLTPLTLALSRQGRENYEVRLPRPDEPEQAMAKGAIAGAVPSASEEH